MSKLLKMVKLHPWLLELIGTPNIRCNRKNYPMNECLKKLVEWAEKRLNYVAFRPFESLDLDAGAVTCQSYGSAPHNWGMPRGKWAGLDNEYRFRRVDYVLYFHIKGEEKPRHRYMGIILSYPEHHDGYAGPATIRAAIRDLLNWSKEYWAKQEDRELVFNMVIKTLDEGWSMQGVDRQTIEIYNFPEDFDPTQV